MLRQSRLSRHMFRDFAVMLGAAVVGTVVCVLALLRDGLFHAFFIGVGGAPLGSIVAVLVVDVRARRAKRGTVLGLFMGAVFCVGVFLLAIENLYGRGLLGFCAVVMLSPISCYCGYRLGAFLGKPTSMEFEPTGYITITGDGFTVLKWNRQIAGSIQWLDVQEVVAYKRDLLTVDQICVAFVTADGGLQVDEECDGFRELMTALPVHLPGALSYDDVFLDVAVPAFRTNKTTLFKRTA